MNPLITVCMIIKDEEAVLDRCLQSLTPYVDEIIIVDTGSIDSSKEIALKYTKHVYDFKWVNNFSAARNESLKYATSQFILVLDADEYMDEGNLSSLRDILSKEKPKKDTLYQLTVVSLKERNKPSTEEPILRAFANHSNIKYVRPIHEQPTPHSSPSTKVITLPVKIYHTGYTEEVIQAKNKNERNMDIFAEMQKRSQLSPYDRCMLGRQLLMMGKHEEALEHLQTALKHGNKKEIWFKHNLVSILELYLTANRLVDAYVFIQNHLIPYLKYPDIRCLYAIVLQGLGFWSAAKKEFKEAYRLAEKRAASGMENALISSDLGFRGPIWHTAIINENEQNYNEAIHYLTKLLTVNKHDMEPLSKLIELLSINEKPEITIEFLEQLIQATTDTTSNAIVGKLSISLFKRELAQHYCGNKLLSGLFNASEQLRYALLANNEALFQTLITKIDSNKLNEVTIARQVTLGVVVWNRRDWIPFITGNDVHKEFVSYISSDSIPEDLTKWATVAYELITELYMLQQWDAFEHILSQFETPNMINLISNFFLSKHDISTALQYYQHLLDQGLMDVDSYANLAFYHYSQNHTKEALALWEKAIHLQPTRKRLYIMYCEVCKDRDSKQEMKDKLLKLDKEFDKLMIFREL
jgi:glycosyltransferase involved in cell wall biosynthesis